MAKFSLDTPVKDLIADPESAAIMREVIPDLIDGPMAGMVKDLPMSLNAIMKYAAGQIPEEKLKELEEKLAALG